MAGYIKVGDIKGESVEPKHKDWINLLSVSQSITRPMAAGSSGSTRHRASATLGDLVLVKELDKSTPKLMESICLGTNYPSVHLDLTTSSEGQERTPYFQWELTNARVTSYSVSGNCEGSGGVPTESFSLNFEEIKWTYNVLDKKNAVQGKVEATWKVEEGTV
jgi:type VI secretion system secreted protein Hcp